MCACVRACVRKRERERVCVSERECVCLREREKQTDRQRNKASNWMLMSCEKQRVSSGRRSTISTIGVNTQFKLLLSVLYPTEL